MQADIGLGLLVAALASQVFGVEISGLLVFVAVVSVLLPDIDFLVEFIKHGSVGGKVVREHRELLHFPAVYIPVALFIWLAIGDIWAFVFFLCIFLHFLHDSIGIGWGVKWFWPLSKNSYKFFSEVDAEMSSNFIQVWKPEDLPRLVAEHGKPNWIQEYYLKFHSISAVEWVVFAIGVSVFILSL